MVTSILSPVYFGRARALTIFPLVTPNKFQRRAYRSFCTVIFDLTDLVTATAALKDVESRIFRATFREEGREPLNGASDLVKLETVCAGLRKDLYSGERPTSLRSGFRLKELINEDIY